MKVQDVMTPTPVTCLIQDPLNVVAQRLWQRDCGCLPVVDPELRPLAMITDRDVCMAAMTTGKPLHELQVGQAMSKEVTAARQDEDLAAAGARMAAKGVRRVPVVDENGVLRGVLSLNDLAVRAAGETGAKTPGIATEAMRVLCAVSRHRGEQDADAGQQGRAPQQAQGQSAQQQPQQARGAQSGRMATSAGGESAQSATA
jgi:CBS domain-containing protein